VAQWAPPAERVLFEQNQPVAANGKDGRSVTHIRPWALWTSKFPVLISCADAQVITIADDCRRRRVGSKGAASAEAGSAGRVLLGSWLQRGRCRGSGWVG
jgi:hypothetical protein